MKSSQKKKVKDDSHLKKSNSIISGSLGKLTLSKRWVKRNYVLEEDKIVYWSKGRTKCNEIQMCNVMSVQYIGTFGKEKYVFKIQMLGRELYVKGSSEDQSLLWVRRIDECIDELRSTAKKRFLMSDTRGTKSKSKARFMLRKEGERIRKSAKNRTKQLCHVDLADFEKIRVIGIGSVGTVYLCRLIGTDEYYAMKVLKKSNIKKKSRAMNERKVLAKIRHPFLMSLYYAFQTESSLYLIMDFINGGELFHHLEMVDRFEEDRTKFYAAEIVLALEYLHEKGVLYRDLKPENVLIDAKGHIVLTDFGLAKEMREDESTDSFCGTLEYLSPEIIIGDSYTSKVDWWAFGMIVYEMATGYPAFESDSQSGVFNLILEGNIKYPDYLSPELVDLIKRLTEIDPELRLSDPTHIKNHPFFSDINWTLLLNRRVRPPYIPDLRGS
eukprot:TRINITY_DN5734_c0_g1_i1.p1 TRINITY_DN5734_c0_g1~~TRINITY_DN5734_c0_g1_i1.p1  ORF type:complete len:440 (+),score=86.89 TRINITY_DN5734_c0_g1_i1:84-1403(+)